MYWMTSSFTNQVLYGRKRQILRKVTQ